MKAELGSGGGGDAPQLEQGGKEGAVIVRIAGEGQFRASRRGRRAPQRAGQPRRRRRRGGRRGRLSRALDPDARPGQADGQDLDDDELAESDVILPPRDISFEEAQAEFTGEGLIPD